MIEKMHEKSNGPVFKIIFALVSISFVLGGIGGGLMGTDTSAVKVNGKEISQQYFSQAKAREQNVRNAQEGEKFWDNLRHNDAYARQFHQDVANILVREELLRQYAQELKLNVSDAQIKSEIVNNPNFQQDGKFNNAIYQQALRSSEIHPDQYAAIVKEGILMSQLQEGIIASDFTVPAQQDLLAKLLLQKRQVRFATYPLVAETANQTASDAEIEAFYNAHKNQFVTPEKLTVEYVTISPKEVEKKVEVSDAQIETYYQTNKARFVTAGESQLAHIQVQSEAEANTIVQAVKNGEDFAKLAKEKSQDKGSASQGGNLGWAKAGTFPKAFEEAAAALQVGQTSQAVKVDNTFHIIKVLDRKAEAAIPLEKVKDQIAKTIRDELVMTEYSTLTREMLKKAFENSSSLTEVAQLAGLTVQKTAEFTPQNIPAELNNEKITQTIFNGDLRKNGQNSDAIELGDTNSPQTMFLRVSQYQAEAVQSLAEAKNAVIEAVKLEKAGKALTTNAEEALKALQAGNIDAAKFGEAKEFVFAQAQVQQPELANIIFAMAKPADKANYQVAREANGDVIIIALDKVTDGQPAQFKPLAAQIAQADQVVLYQNLLNDLRERAKIEINEDFMQQQLESSK